MVAVLYSRLSPADLRAFLAQQPDFAVQQNCIVRNKDAIDWIVAPTRAQDWPWRVELRAQPMVDGSAALHNAVALLLAEHPDVTAERAALLGNNETLRLRSIAPAAVWRTLWPCIEEAVQALRYDGKFHTRPVECSVSNLDDWLASAADAFTIWSADLAGVRITVKQRHADLTSVTLAQVTTADDLAGRAADTVSEYVARAEQQWRHLTAEARRLFAAALDTASNEEPGPYPLWSRSPLALRLDFWRWLYWRAAVTRRPLDVIIAEANAIPDTADGWRRNLLKHFDDERLHAWDPPNAPPENFEIEAVVAALKRGVRN